MGADHELTELVAGMPIIYGGNQLTAVPPELAAAFKAGDRLLVLQRTGDLLHVPAADGALVDNAMSSALAAFAALGSISDEAITAFYDAFARRLDDESTFAKIEAANEVDVDRARSAGRSTTRLVLSAAMRADMIAGLEVWRDTPSLRDHVVETVRHEGWTVEQRRAGLGVVGFVFEGRPNVFADATGVLRAGNTVVFRIGSDALGTAEAMVGHALTPALFEAGLPQGAVQLLATPSRSAGYALFNDHRLALAVARGSGAAVAQLGAVAAQAGTPVSLHGTGGAWMIVGDKASSRPFALAVTASLDRKVCNTLNVCCIPRQRAAEFVPIFLEALDDAAQRRGTEARLHVVSGSERYLEPARFERLARIERADGTRSEPAASSIDEAGLAIEWEWEHSPEATLVITDDVDHAVDLCNTYSPRFTVSLISDDPGEHDRVWMAVDAPFVGNGFTRWVDGQYALKRPELGLSNWQGGRLFGRSAVMSGDTAFTIRSRAIQSDPSLHR